MALLNRDRYPTRRGTQRRTAPEAMDRTMLAARCLELRREHLTMAEIARRLSVDGSAKIDERDVSRLITWALKEFIAPVAEEVKLQQLDRLDKLYNRAAQIAMQDKNKDRVPALGMALKALEREAALLGLDAPKQTEVKDTTPHVVAPATAEEIVAQLAQEYERDRSPEGSGPGAPVDREPRQQV